MNIEGRKDRIRGDERRRKDGKRNRRGILEYGRRV
jgi:hypothetical protein